ncbi:MAG: hypothetical protein MRY63_06370 [Neomegalonema sp.]|nr:hypothetical protein [Neomegalonema sp.]
MTDYSLVSAHALIDAEGFVKFMTADASAPVYNSAGVNVHSLRWHLDRITPNELLIEASDFAAGIEPIGVVSALPDLYLYEGPRVVLLTSDGRLYRQVGGAWSAAVPAADIEGVIEGAQIALASVTSALLAPGAVSAQALASGAVTPAALADAAVTADKIAPLAIAAPHLSDAVVTAAKLASGAVTPAALADAAVTADKVAPSAITGPAIAPSAVTANAIAANAIDASKITAGAIGATQIAANAVTAAAIAANAIDASKISAGAIGADQIAASAIIAGKIAANAVTAATIAANAIDASKISAGAIGATQIAANAITSAKIAAGAIEADKIAANAVTAGAIAAGAVNAAAIQAGAVNADHITAGSLSVAHLRVTGGAGGNLNADPLFEDAEYWGTGSGSAEWTLSATGYAGSLRTINALQAPISASTAQLRLEGPDIPLEAGRRYLVRWIARTSDGGAGRELGVQIRCSDRLGGYLQLPSSSITPSNVYPAEGEFSFVAPDGVATGRILPFTEGGAASATVRFGRIDVVPMAQTNEIAEAAITDFLYHSSSVEQSVAVNTTSWADVREMALTYDSLGEPMRVNFIAEWTDGYGDSAGVKTAGNIQFRLVRNGSVIRAWRHAPGDTGPNYVPQYQQEFWDASPPAGLNQYKVQVAAPALPAGTKVPFRIGYTSLLLQGFKR